jgi:cell division protein ZapA
MKKTHLVTVLGREIPVKSSAPEEKVREVESFVNDRIGEIQSRLTAADPQLLVTLALLNLAESYMELHRTQGGAETIESRISLLLDRLEKTV